MRARAHNKAGIGKHSFMWICIRLCMTKIRYVESVRRKCGNAYNYSCLSHKKKKEKSRLLNNFRICHQRHGRLSVVSRDPICTPTKLLQETHTHTRIEKWIWLLFLTHCLLPLSQSIFSWLLPKFPDAISKENNCSK